MNSHFANSQARIAGKLASPDAVLSLTESPGIARFISLYAEIRPGDGAEIPARDAFLPEELGAFLADAAVIGYREDGEPVFRLVGETVRSRFNVSPVGELYRDFVPAERADTAVSVFTKCRAHRCGMFMRLRKLHSNDLIVELDVLGLPFLPRGGRGDDAIDCFIFVDHEREIVKATGYSAPSGAVTRIVSRHFVDLGSGVPEDHVDIVET